MNDWWGTAFDIMIGLRLPSLVLTVRIENCAHEPIIFQMDNWLRLTCDRLTGCELYMSSYQSACILGQKLWLIMTFNHNADGPCIRDGLTTNLKFKLKICPNYHYDNIIDIYVINFFSARSSKTHAPRVRSAVSIKIQSNWHLIHLMDGCHMVKQRPIMTPIWLIKQK